MTVSTGHCAWANAQRRRPIHRIRISTFVATDVVRSSFNRENYLALCLTTQRICRTTSNKTGFSESPNSACEINSTDPLSCVLVSFAAIHSREHLPPALSAVSVRENFSIFTVLGFSQDERSMSDLRSPFQPRARIFSGRHVHQLRFGSRTYLCLWCSPLVAHSLAFGQDRNLGSPPLLTLRTHPDIPCTRALDLPRSDVRSRDQLGRSRQ